MNTQCASLCEWQLSTLLKDWVNVSNDDDVVVTGVSQNSEDTSTGDLFLATAGKHRHGLEYCADAVSKGAAAIAWEPSNNLQPVLREQSVPAIEFQELSKYVGDITTRCYGDLTDQIEAIAVTGTDGKSSVAHLTAQALEILAERCGLIGTLGYGKLSDLATASHTTPPVTRMAKELAKLVHAGFGKVAIEASSHGISQNRLAHVDIDTAVLTNITRDHLDYHNSLDEYVNTKARLFFACHPRTVVLNYDDQYGRLWSRDLVDSVRVLTYSIEDAKADVYASAIKYNPFGTRFDLHINNKTLNVQTSLLGAFNVLNVLAVTAILLGQEKHHHEIITALQGLQPVPGRMQLVQSGHGPNVIVDYAHTPAALSAAISAVREHYTGKLVCVLGCGGDRDSGKRAEMGAVATAMADDAIITSDNPRSEDPRKIIDEIVDGCDRKSGYQTIVDRKEAIEYAVTSVGDNDVVLIAGKGHEKYQQIGDKKFEFDDVAVATTMLNRLTHA